MASFDAPNKIITGLQLLQAGIIDRETMQQEMDGLENISVINERITKEKSENIMDQMLIQRSQQGDNSALMAIVEIYNNPKNKGEILEKYFTAQGEQPSPEEQALLQQAQMQQQAGPPNLQQMLGGSIMAYDAEEFARIIARNFPEQPMFKPEMYELTGEEMKHETVYSLCTWYWKNRHNIYT